MTLSLVLLVLLAFCYPMTVRYTVGLVQIIRSRQLLQPRYLDFMMAMLVLFVLTTAVYQAAMLPARAGYSPNAKATFALIYPFAGGAGVLITPVALYYGYRRLLAALWAEDDRGARRLGRHAGRWFGLGALFLLGSLLVQHWFKLVV